MTTILDKHDIHSITDLLKRVKEELKTSHKLDQTFLSNPNYPTKACLLPVLLKQVKHLSNMQDQHGLKQKALTKFSNQR